jgi:site-specific recombinase XerD
MKTHTLKPYIRKDRINSKGECPINIRYTYQRKVLNIPIGIVIKPENWSEDEDYPIQNKSYNFKEVIRKIDNKLTELENLISDYYRKFESSPSIIELKELLSNSTPRSKDISVLNSLEKYINHLKSEPNISPNTIKVFRSTYNHFSDFEKNEGKKYNIYDLNKSILEEFSSYLQFEDLQISSVGKYVKTMKTFINKYLIEQLNLDINQTFRNVKLKKEDRKKNDVLTLKELELLKYNVFFSNYNIEEYNQKNKEYNLIRFELSEREILIGRIFLLLCSTGLSYVDIMRLSINNFYRIELDEIKLKEDKVKKENSNQNDSEELEEGIVIRIERKKIKSNNLCIIPVFGSTLDILTSELLRKTGSEIDGSMYEGFELNEKTRTKFFWNTLQKMIRMSDNNEIKDDKVFQYISNQYFNREIKKIFKKIGVNQRITFYKRDRHRTEVIKHKYDLISSHTGRRTYISINLQNGVRIDTIMKTTGHSNYKTILVYVEQKEESIYKEFYYKTDN